LFLALYNKGDGIKRDDVAETDSIERPYEKCETPKESI